MLKSSYLKLSSFGFLATFPTVVINDVEFYNSLWEFYEIDLTMTNCNSSLLSLEVNSCNRNSTFTNSTSIVKIQNAVFGYWRFNCVQYVHIKNCSIITDSSNYNQSIVNLTNSSAILENILMHGVSLKCVNKILCGLIVSQFSKIKMKNLFFEKKTKMDQFHLQLVAVWPLKIVHFWTTMLCDV